MKQTSKIASSTLAFALVAIAAITLTTGVAAASISIDLSVDNETVDDGDSVEVDGIAEIEIYVESERDLNFVRTTLGTEEYAVGVNATEFHLNQTLTTTLGENTYTVYAEDVDESSASKSVTLDRPPRTEAEFRQVVQQYERDLELIESEMEGLREARDNLSAENEQLRHQIQELEEELEEEEGLPGFGVGVAVAALLTAAAYRVRKKRI